MERRVNIPVKEARDFFHSFSVILQPFTKIAEKDARVFGELLYQSYKRKGIPNLKERFKLVFDQDVRAEMCEVLDMSNAALNVALTRLRKRKLIGRNNIISKYYLLEPDENDLEVSITFQFKRKNL